MYDCARQFVSGSCFTIMFLQGNNAETVVIMLIFHFIIRFEQLIWSNLFSWDKMLTKRKSAHAISSSPSGVQEHQCLLG